ncbi:histidine phosphatase family protein [Sphingomonas sp.]|uniref:histidine phosphatase family protein n=1 Tax=Sphingomonas sp. TaxID=28214 RepID=UPI003B3B2E14
MGLVFLARHGSHDEVGHVLSGRSDIALNEAGRAQARWLAGRLADVPLAAIFASPRRRAQETAAPIATAHGLPVQTSAAWDEIDFGAWAGQPFAALDRRSDWQCWNGARGRAVTPAGDTMAAATRRAVDHLEHLEEEGPVLCVSHCDVIRGVVSQYLGLDADRILSFDCDPGSLTTLSLYQGGGRVVALNERLS